MPLYAWVHPIEPSLVVIRDDEGMYFGFDKRYSRSFSDMGTFTEALRWVSRRYAEQN